MYLLTEQDKSQEINSQGNSGVSNNIGVNNGVVKNFNFNFNIPALPVPPVLYLGKKVYNTFESNVCVALEIIHLSNNILYDYAKTNPPAYEFLINTLEEVLFKEFLTNTLEEDLFKSHCTKMSEAINLLQGRNDH